MVLPIAEHHKFKLAFRGKGRCIWLMYFNNNNGLFMLFYLYFIKILVFPLKCIQYVDIILQGYQSRRKIRELLAQKTAEDITPPQLSAVKFQWSNCYVILQTVLSCKARLITNMRQTQENVTDHLTYTTWVLARKVCLQIKCRPYTLKIEATVDNMAGQGLCWPRCKD